MSITNVDRETKYNTHKDMKQVLRIIIWSSFYLYEIYLKNFYQRF